ncbi:IS110 family transposase [Planococcus halocryophilus]|uniref:IS110 family transposase n=1 Tax=Planococcus halocryophilus TaxID=1215089 RepID=A0A1C7DUP8_9BACL|nr:IS110 family transposase [Planococcus halocryophilus]ANU15236.1 IS110 family transposase [Planococcus halocryophilus]
MVLSTFNHIQGSNGSHWNRLMRGENAEKICIVAIDAAKFVNAAMICNVYGDILVKPFEFNASSTGFHRLVKEIEEAKEGYAFEEVVVGIETTGHYYEDLVRLCEQKKFIVRIINAATTAKERETVLNYTKTDNVDLMAITQSLLHGRGQTSQEALPLLEQLKMLSRAHRALVNTHSQTINHIRLYMDHIFREFQGIVEEVDGEKVILKIFSTFDSKSSRFLMRHYPHPSDILKLGEAGLRQVSIEQNLKMRDQSIERLVRFARQSVSKPKMFLQAELLMLRLKLDELELKAAQAAQVKAEMEQVLLQTDGGILLSIPGVGVITASELTAEIGDFSLFTRPEQLIKMAGTNPIIRQSGGKKATSHRISKQGRADFRGAVYRAGKAMMGQNPTMKKKAEELKAKGKKIGQIYIALGNRLLRLAFAMMKKKQVYQTGPEGKSLQSVIASKLRNKEKQALFFNRYVLN